MSPTLGRLVPPLALALALAGCSPPVAVTPTGGVPPSPTTPLTPPPPTDPPEPPTDLPTPRVLVGQISQGGNGPCYGLINDDGQEFALYGPDMGTFPTGTRVRATAGPLADSADCGTGRPVRLIKIERVG